VCVCVCREEYDKREQDLKQQKKVHSQVVQVRAVRVCMRSCLNTINMTALTMMCVCVNHVLIHVIIIVIIIIILYVWLYIF